MFTWLRLGSLLLLRKPAGRLGVVRIRRGCGGGGWLTQGPFLAEIEGV